MTAILIRARIEKGWRHGRHTPGEENKWTLFHDVRNVNTKKEASYFYRSQFIILFSSYLVIYIIFM